MEGENWTLWFRKKLIAFLRAFVQSFSYFTHFAYELQSDLAVV
jgi:hypothetical protein